MNSYQTPQSLYALQALATWKVCGFHPGSKANADANADGVDGDDE